MSRFIVLNDYQLKFHTFASEEDAKKCGLSDPDNTNFTIVPLGDVGTYVSVSPPVVEVTEGVNVY